MLTTQILKTKVYDLEGKEKGEIDLPQVFLTPVRLDLIKKAVIAIQSHRFQPKGRDLMAGKRTTAESLGVGYGLSRLPRVKGENYPKARVAAFAPNTVGGRLAFPPTPEKKIKKKINKKEKLLALKSAIAATAIKELVAKRGHKFDLTKTLPLVVSDEIQNVTKTSDIVQILKKLGVWNDVEKVALTVKIRAGKGKKRGRRKKMRIGPLIVIMNDNGVKKAARNIPGVTVVELKNLNPEHLAPGTHPGRLTIWVESAIKALSEGKFK
ncbi:MAG: 50S ribosomal protein L4 [Candidatus Bathyarchaeia archaeon]|nr:50S ribosomal protein L4 [Candidatus Bathyarchaeota archaeon]